MIYKTRKVGSRKHRGGKSMRKHRGGKSMRKHRGSKRRHMRKSMHGGASCEWKMKLTLPENYDVEELSEHPNAQSALLEDVFRLMRESSDIQINKENGMIVVKGEIDDNVITNGDYDNEKDEEFEFELKEMTLKC